MMKSNLYKTDRFDPISLLAMRKSIFDYAEAIGGLPNNHSEVFNKRGWMLPFLFAYDDLLWGRWSYWFEILEKKTIEGSDPIPQIKWTDRSSDGFQATMKMLKKCLSYYNSTIDKFADWLNWSLSINQKTIIDHITPELNEHYYKTFDLFLILDNPTDYLSELLTEETGKAYKSGLGYYPTPFNTTLLVTEMTFSDNKDYKKEVISDPCVGCGAMLLPASNYTLRGFGQDISRIAVELCKIQMYWYAPWYAFHPDNIEGFNDEVILVDKNPTKGVKEGQLYFSLV